MKKIFGLFILSLMATTGCTMIVSDPHPTYIVSEVGYRGDRPAEVYFYGGYYYYAPCSYIDSHYYHQRVTYYNSYSMRIVHCERPRDTIIIKEAPRNNTVVIKEDNYRNNQDTVVIKEAAPRNTVVIKEESPRQNTIVVREPAQRQNTVVIKEPAQRQNTVVIKENKSPDRSSSSRSNSSSGNKVIIKK